MNEIYILIGSYIEKEHFEYFIKEYFKNKISVSNSEYERVLFREFKKRKNVFFISAPNVGRYPFSTKKMFLKTDYKKNSLIECSYCTIIGLSNFSKSLSIKRKLKNILKANVGKKIYVIACEAHKPYIDALKYAKKIYKCRTLLIVPDDPNSMIFSKNLIYKILKKFNTNSIRLLSKKYVDCFLFFTKGIEKKFNFEKPYVIREGIIEEFCKNNKTNLNKHCTYIGKTDLINGINYIIDCAKLLPNFTFDIYGSGDYDVLLKKLNLPNLFFHGFLNPEKVNDVIKNSDILLSPRIDDDLVSIYAFPSKILKYISFCKPIITFKLPCYSQIFDSYLKYPKNESSEALTKTILEVYHHYTLNNLNTNIRNFNYLLSKNIVNDLIKLVNN